MDSPKSNEHTPSIVICWELGGGLGHLVKGAMLASRLLERGCEVSFAVRDLTSAHSLLPEDNYCLVQAPYFDGSLRDWGPPADYAELLLHAGWGDANGLRARVRGWRGLFDALRADLVIADHAPTAVLAAQTQNIPVALWGHGFGAPTPTWPVFRTWEPTPAARLAQVRQHILTTLNSALTHFGSEPRSAPEPLLDTAANFLCTWPEIDHYPGRLGGHYLGPLWPSGIGASPDWGNPPPGQAKVFAYLRPNLPGLDQVLRALGRIDAAVLVHLNEHQRLPAAQSAPKNIRFTDRLIDIEAVSREANLVICSGTDTLHGMAVRGVPTLSLPMNAEQRMGAERLAANGAGRYLIPEASPAFEKEMLDTSQSLLTDPAFRIAGQRLQPANHDAHQALERVAERCVELAMSFAQANA